MRDLPILLFVTGIIFLERLRFLEGKGQGLIIAVSRRRSYVGGLVALCRGNLPIGITVEVAISQWDAMIVYVKIQIAGFALE